MPPKKPIMLTALSLAVLLLAAVSGTARHVGLVIVEEIRLLEITLERESRVQLRSLRYEHGWFGGTVHFDALLDVDPEPVISLLAASHGALPNPRGLEIQGNLEIRHGPWLGWEVGFGAAHARGRIPLLPFIADVRPENEYGSIETTALEFVMQMDWARNLRLTLRGGGARPTPTTARLDIRSRPMGLVIDIGNEHRRLDVHSDGLFLNGELLADWPAYFKILLAGSLVPAPEMGLPPERFEPARPQWPPMEPGHPVFGVLRADATLAKSPIERMLLAGGHFQLTEAQGSDCLGHVHPWAPDFLVDTHFLPPETSLELRASAGTVLILRTESGDWLCDAGNAEHPPQLVLHEPGPGVYELWLATWIEGPQPAQLGLGLKLR